MSTNSSKHSTWDDKTEAWITLVAAGDGREKQPQQQNNIPIYGEINPPLDQDEVAAASLPPDFATLGAITVERGGFESVFCQTKQLWSRVHHGNPKEQEQEWLEGEYNKSISEGDIILENQSREVFNPDSNIIDWRKQKATDLRNNPKVYLPKP